MNTIIEIINTAAQAFIEFAWPMLIQSSVLILIILLVDQLIKKKVRAIFRYCIWMLVLIKLILPVSLTLPLSIGRLMGDKIEAISVTIPQPAPELVTTTAPEPLTPIEFGPAGDIVIQPTPELYTHTVTTTQLPQPAQPATVTQSPPVQTTPLTWAGALLLTYLAIITTMSLLLIQRAIFVTQLVAQSKKANGLVAETLKFCQQQMNMKKTVQLKVSPNTTSPAVCGLLRPVILIPRHLGPSLGPAQLRSILFHELVHVKRADLWTNLAQTLLQIIYFYNPLLWLANAFIRRIREQAVDEAVLVHMGKKADKYPETLLSVAKLAFQRPALSLRLIGVVESKSALAQRIKHILTRPIPKSAKLGILSLAAVIIIGTILLPMAKAEKVDNSTIITKEYRLKHPVTQIQMSKITRQITNELDGSVSDYLKDLFGKNQMTHEVMGYHNLGTIFLFAAEPDQSKAKKFLKNNYASLLRPEKLYNINDVADAGKFAENFASIVKQVFTRQNFSFLDAEDIDFIAQDLDHFIRTHTREDLPSQTRLEILEKLDKYLYDSFPSMTVKQQEDIYLNFDDKIKTLKLKLWQVIATEPLTEQQQQTLKEQKKWIYDHLNISSQPPMAIAGKRHRLDKVFDDVLNGFSRQPMSEATFENFKDQINKEKGEQHEFLSRVASATSCWSTEIAANDYYQPHRKNKEKWTFPFGTVKGYSGGSDRIDFNFEPEKPRLSDTVWLSDISDKNPTHHSYDIASQKELIVPDDYRTKAKLIEWLNLQNKGDIYYDKQNESIIACRDAKMAPLNVNNWIDSDRIPTEKLRQHINDNSVKSFSFSAYTNLGDHMLRTKNRPIAPIIAIQAKSGAIALIQTYNLPHRRKNELWLKIRHRPENWRSQWFSTYIKDQINSSNTTTELLLPLPKPFKPTESWKAKPIKKTSLTSFWGGWKNLPFEISKSEQAAVKQCKDILVYSISNTNGEPDIEDTERHRKVFESVLNTNPDFFYAQFLLANWHRLYGDPEKSKTLFQLAYKNAPVILVQKYQDENGKPIADLEIQTYTIECNKVKNGSLSNFKLRFRDLTTDEDGCIYLPVYDTVFRRSSATLPEGLNIAYPTLGFFKADSKVAMLPTAKSNSTDGGLYETAKPSKNLKAKVGPTTFEVDMVARFDRDGQSLFEKGTGEKLTDVDLKALAFPQAPWLDIAKVFLTTPANKYDVLELRVFDHSKRKLLSSEDYAAVGYNFSNSIISLYSIGQLLPDEIDVWMRVLHKPDASAVTIKATKGASAQIKGKIVTLSEIKPGIHGYRSTTGPNGKPQVTWTKHQTEYGNKACMAVFYFDRSDENKYQIVAVSKGNDRVIFDSPHFIGARQKCHVLTFGLPADQIDHFEISPFISRDTFYFDGIKLPKVSGNFQPIPEITFQIAGNQGNFTNYALGPFKLELQTFKNKRVTGLGTGSKPWECSFSTKQANEGTAGFAFIAPNLSMKPPTMKYYDKQGNDITPKQTRTGSGHGKTLTMAYNSINQPIENIHTVKLSIPGTKPAEPVKIDREDRSKYGGETGTTQDPDTEINPNTNPSNISAPKDIKLPMDIRLFGIRPNTSDTIYDLNGKKLRETLGIAMKDSPVWPADRIRCDFILELDDTGDDSNLFAPSTIKDSGTEKILSRSVNRYSFVYEGKRLIWLSAAFPREYKKSYLNDLYRKNKQVRQIDLAIPYYSGPRGKSDFKIIGPFTDGQTISPEGSAFQIEVKQIGRTAKSVEFELKSNSQFDVNTNLLVYDTQGKRHIANRTGYSAKTHSTRISYVVPDIKPKEVNLITVGEKSHIKTFTNLPVDFPELEKRNNAKYLDELVMTLGSKNRRLDNFNFESLDEAMKVIDVVRGNHILKAYDVIMRGTRGNAPLDFSNMNKQQAEKLRNVALKWSKAIDHKIRATGIEIGLKGQWPEFVAPAFELLQQRNSNDLQYMNEAQLQVAMALSNYNGDLSPKQISTIKNILTNKEYGQIDEITPNQIESKTFKNTQPKYGGGTGAPEAKLHWGEPVNGLRAAVELLSKQDCFAYGDKIELQFHIQNVSDHDISFVTEAIRNDHTNCTITDTNGKKYPVTSISYSGFSGHYRLTLAHGEMVPIASLPFLVGDNTSSNRTIGSKAGHVAELPPGQFLINYELFFPHHSHYPKSWPEKIKPDNWQQHLKDMQPNLHDSIERMLPPQTLPKPGDWSGTLKTANIPLCIKPADQPKTIERPQRISQLPTRPAAAENIIQVNENGTLYKSDTKHGGNGHFYQPVFVPQGISWDQANIAAQQAGGHLVTITSQAENLFVFGLIQDDKYWSYDTNTLLGPWIGGFQPPGSPEPAGNWQWITGEPFTYQNWDRNRPNNIDNNENAMHFGLKNAKVPTWNDLHSTQKLVRAYIVEFENVKTILYETPNTTRQPLPPPRFERNEPIDRTIVQNNNTYEPDDTYATAPNNSFTSPPRPVRPAPNTQFQPAPLNKWPANLGGNDHFYQPVYVPGGITWYDAQNHASRAGGYLATLTSQKENYFVFGLIQEEQFWHYDNTNLLGPWIGGFQPPGSAEPGANWQWTTGEPFQYQNWDRNRPNNSGGDENCMHFGLKNAKVPTWNDLPGSQNQVRAFIIEYDPPQGTKRVLRQITTNPDKLKPLQVAQSFIQAAADNNTDIAKKLTKPNSPAADQIEIVTQTIEDKNIKIEKLTVNKDTAIAVTSTVIKNFAGKEDVLILNLKQENDKWLVTDIDLQSKQKAEELIGDTPNLISENTPEGPIYQNASVTMHHFQTDQNNWLHPNPTQPPADNKFQDQSPKQLLPIILDRRHDDWYLAAAWFVWKTKDPQTGPALRNELADRIVEEIHKIEKDQMKTTHDYHHWAQLLGPINARKQNLQLLKECEIFSCHYGPQLVESLAQCGNIADVPALIDAIDKESEGAGPVVNKALTTLTGVQMPLYKNQYTNKTKWQIWWNENKNNYNIPETPEISKTTPNDLPISNPEADPELIRADEKLKKQKRVESSFGAEFPGSFANLKLDTFSSGTGDFCQKVRFDISEKDLITMIEKSAKLSFKYSDLKQDRSIVEKVCKIGPVNNKLEFWQEQKQKKIICTFQEKKSSSRSGTYYYVGINKLDHDHLRVYFMYGGWVN